MFSTEPEKHPEDIKSLYAFFLVYSRLPRGGHDKCFYDLWRLTSKGV